MNDLHRFPYSEHQFLPVVKTKLTPWLFSFARVNIRGKGSIQAVV